MSSARSPSTPKAGRARLYEPEQHGTPDTVRYALDQRSPETLQFSPASARRQPSPRPMQAFPSTHASPSQPYVPQPTKRSQQRASETRRVVLQRKLQRAKTQPWVVPDTTAWSQDLDAPFPGRSHRLAQQLTHSEAKRVPAGTYKQLEDQFSEDYANIKQRLEDVLARCSSLQSSLAPPAAPEPWQQPYPAGSDIITLTGDALSPNAGLQAAARLQGIAAKLRQGIAQRTLAQAGGLRPRTEPTPKHINVLLSDARGLHAGALAYQDTTQTAAPQPNTAPVLAPVASVASTSLLSHTGATSAAATPPNAPQVELQADVPTTTPSLWSNAARPGQPMPLTFPESTNKFFGGGIISAAVREVFRSAQSNPLLQGLSHRERLQAGIRVLNAEFFGPLAPPLNSM